MVEAKQDACRLIPAHGPPLCHLGLTLKALVSSDQCFLRGCIDYTVLMRTGGRRTRSLGLVLFCLVGVEDCPGDLVFLTFFPHLSSTQYVHIS